MKGKSSPVFVTSTVKANKFMSRMQILLLEALKPEKLPQLWALVYLTVFIGIRYVLHARRGQGGGRA